MKEPDEFWLKKAETLKKLGKFEESLKCVDKAYEIKSSEKKPDYWFQKGMSFAETGNYEEAISCFDNDVKVNGTSFQTLFEKAVSLLLSKKHSEALEYFNKAYETVHEEFMEHKVQAENLKAHKKFEKAVLHSDMAVRIKPVTSKFWHLKGVTLHKLGKYNQALVCYDKALELKNDDPELIYDFAKIQLLLGDTDKCLNALENACDLDSDLRKTLSVDPVFEKLDDDDRFRQIRDYETIKTLKSDKEKSHQLNVV